MANMTRQRELERLNRLRVEANIRNQGPGWMPKQLTESERRARDAELIKKVTLPDPEKLAEGLKAVRPLWEGVSEGVHFVPESEKE